MDFEKEARDIAQMVSGMPDPGCFGARDLILGALRRAYAAGQENMRESASYISQQWQVPQFAKLMAGEMTAQESRTVYAVAVSITDRIRSLPLEQAPKVNEFTPLATTKDIGLE